MDLTGNVVVTKDLPPNKALEVVCPRCSAPKGTYCNPEKEQVCGERVVSIFAKESKNLTGDPEE